MIIPHDVEESFIGLQNPAVEIPDEGADDVGVDQAPNFRFAFPQCLFGLLALHVLDPQHFVRDFPIFDWRRAASHKSSYDHVVRPELSLPGR